MITSQWAPVIDGHTEYRYVGPAWIATLIVWADGREIHPVVSRVFGFVSKIFGARLEYREMRPSCEGQSDECRDLVDLMTQTFWHGAQDCEWVTKVKPDFTSGGKTMIPESEWTWYGFAGHLCVSRHCLYHLCTRIGDRLVSTVGAYFPDFLNGEMETVGSGAKDYFETMTFVCDGEDEHGNPNQGEEVGCVRYATSIEAERGHRLICKQVAGD